LIGDILVMNLNPKGISYLVNLTGYASEPFEVVSLYLLKK
jgi:hypothetical protein